MSHEIVDNQLAYAGETPWHGLGVHVETGMSGAEMLKIAGLDWRVQRRNIAMRDSEGKELLTDPLKGMRAIVRHDTNQVFQIASDRYFPVQNQDIVDFFRQYCEAGHATMETVGAIHGGSTVWALAKLNGGSDAVIGGDDALKGYMLLATSHDGSVRTIGQPTLVRVVCNNTLSAAIAEKSASRFSMKHTRKWTPEVVKEAQQVMGMAIEQIQKTTELASKLSKIKIDVKDWFRFVSTLGGVKTEEEVAANIDSVSQAEVDRAIASLDFDHQPATADFEKLNRVGRSIYKATLQGPGQQLDSARGTAWGALNGVTYYVDHLRSRSQDLRLHNAWFGSGDTLKTQAANTLLEMAGIR